MYVTRALSLYKKFPDLISEKPVEVEGPNSGYLVLYDEEESINPSCFGLSKSTYVKDFPLPSNKIISLGYTNLDAEIFAVPVIDQPLSSNRYYLIKARGKNKGDAYVCSKEEDRGVNCGMSYIKERKPCPLDPKDIYQQFEFHTNTQGFSIKPIASNAHLPKSLKTRSQLLIQTSLKTPNVFEAHGLDSSDRARLPDFDFPLSRETSPSVCVGKWVCPFMFIHEGESVNQVKDSVYYSIALEQRWQRIFTHDSSDSYSVGNNKKVMMDVVIPTQVVAVYGKNAIIDEKRSEPKVTWFMPLGGSGDEPPSSVGLSCYVVERMGWEQKRVGWVSRKERQTRVVGEEEYGGIGWWAKFGCYVLVERFVVTRMDGTLVFTCDFMHTHRIKTKWE